MRIGEYEMTAPPTPAYIREKKQTRFHVVSPHGQAVKKYLISQQSSESGTVYFVSNLDHGFRYMGQLNAWKGTFYQTERSEFGDSTPEVKVLKRALDGLYNRRPLPEGFQVLLYVSKVKDAPKDAPQSRPA